MSETKRILIIDDEQELTEILCDFLSSNSEYHMIVCTDPFEALGLSQKQAFDLIICDYMLPDITGAELLKKIRLNLVNSRTPCILISGNVDLAKENASYFSNLSIMQKPFSMESLLSHISQIFSNINTNSTAA